jgi:hypothetical protein
MWHVHQKLFGQHFLEFTLALEDKSPLPFAPGVESAMVL